MASQNWTPRRYFLTGPTLSHGKTPLLGPGIRQAFRESNLHEGRTMGDQLGQKRSREQIRKHSRSRYDL
jgi:hypothetical protein